jgi:arylsulfatase A-like enzyme
MANPNDSLLSVAIANCPRRGSATSRGSAVDFVTSARRLAPRIALIAALLLIALTVLHAAETVKGKPNILLIVADDLGFSDLGCYGGEIRTTNLDALAAAGIRFTQFYNCARCCPSRASLLTGLYPHQAGVGEMTADEGPPGYRGSLQPHCATIAQVLRTAGYRTAMSGKWHVGDNQPPTARGVDDFYGFVRGYAVDSWEPRMMTRLPEGRSRRAYPSGQFFATDAITDHAIDFLDDARKTKAPWFLYVAYQTPHFPLQSTAEDMRGYAEVYAKGWDSIREQRLARQERLGLTAADTTLTPRSPIPKPDVAKRIASFTADGHNPPWSSLPAERRADLAQRMAVYAGMVTGMDRNIGRLVNDLRGHGELENTLVLFLSDNGACAEWEPFGFDLRPVARPQAGTGINIGTPSAPNVLHRGDDLARMGGPGSLFSYGSGWANACNTPWRLYKHYVHEGGISTPFIVHWPAGTKRRGEIDARAGHVIDLMATCVDAAGATYPKRLGGNALLPMEGRRLLPALGVEESQSRVLFWEHEGNRAVRDGKWKLVALQGGPWELYNVELDRTELTNLAVRHPDIVARLTKAWNEWAKRCWVIRRQGGTGASSHID